MRNKKGKMKCNAMCTKSLPVLGCILVLLSAAPGTARDIDGPISDPYLVVDDETVNLLNGAVVGGVIVYSGGTVNVYPGAYVDWFIWAYGGSTVNIYGGQMGFCSFITVLGGDVTVYGSGFKVDYIEWSAGEFTPAPGNGSVLTGTYENMEGFALKFYGSVPVHLANSAPGLTIDVKPGSDTNVINLNSNGVVPVAVLTTGKIASIDPATVRFAGAAPVHYTLEDVDGDGDDDMLFHFRTQELNLNEESVEATLTAQLMTDSLLTTLSVTNERASVSGTDKVQILPSKSKK